MSQKAEIRRFEFTYSAIDWHLIPHAYACATPTNTNEPRPLLSSSGFCHGAEQLEQASVESSKAPMDTSSGESKVRSPEEDGAVCIHLGSKVRRGRTKFLTWNKILFFAPGAQRKHA